MLINNDTNLDKIAQSMSTEHFMPVLPMREVVLFPTMVAPLFVGRLKSMQAVEEAYFKFDKKLVLLAQKNSMENDPKKEDLYDVGVVTNILQYLKLPDNTVKIVVEGSYTVSVTELIENGAYLRAIVMPYHAEPLSEREHEILIRSLLNQFEAYTKLNKKIPEGVLARIQGYQDAQQITHTIVAYLPIKTEEKQSILESQSLKKRIERLMAIIEAEIDLLQVELRIRVKVKKQMEKTQREYYLNEQIKAIQEELGQQSNEVELLRMKVLNSSMAKEAQEKALLEIDRLKMMPALSAEATVSRHYVECLLSLPWKKRTSEKFDLPKVIEKLDKEHAGLYKVKERIIEYLAVQKRVKKMKGPILCLVGPPGVGKTSLGKSIAEAINRKFCRIALGGVRDESEIRGHRRTYIGAMPGKIIQKITKAQVTNPVILLDEIDKMANDFRGDPAEALLEVLDPEQNQSFNDHYLDIDFDLSDVMFIATANSMNIPVALLDRMEVIKLAGYTEDEKLSIAKDYLLPKQINLNGLKKRELTIDEASLLYIIRHYTLEAGVRNLERELAKICRKVVKRHLTDLNKKETQISVESLDDYLGVLRHRYYHPENAARVGLVNGLAWTEVGGEMLVIEAVVMPGKGKITLTGKLGEVMQESIQAALSVIRSRAESLMLPPAFFDEHDIHVHVPEGATPKDGPSAGITMCIALLSCILKKPVRGDLAMTGEITLRGDILAIGGLKEKLLAARRSNMQLVIIPEDNRRDLKEIPNNILDHLDVRCARSIDEVFELGLLAQ
jgi:ATP-dependent Lon protease